jgi:hypothetical protein
MFMITLILLPFNFVNGEDKWEPHLRAWAEFPTVWSADEGSDPQFIATSFSEAQSD